jgi:serine/threonine protein kinase
MPNFLAAEHGESSRSRSRQRARTEVGEHRNLWDRLSLHKIGGWLKRDEEVPPLDKVEVPEEVASKGNGRPHSSGEHAARHGGLLNRRSSRKVVPGLPRPLTFKRMNSEKRDKLLEVPDVVEQRRAASADRRASNTVKRTLSPPPISVPSMSAPDVLSPHESDAQQKPPPTIGGERDSNIPAGSRQVDYGAEESIDYLSAGEPPPLSIAGDSYMERESHRSSSEVDDVQLQEELEAKWILNLSMHFRDMSDREKFFITFAEEPNKWRRVTVSCDYRRLEPESLEADLKSLHYQRDKSARIYEAIRDSLLDIQFYDTVTNLKLETTDGRLHVHVTEDVNEIIPYPTLSSIDHLQCKRFRESAISFDSHISGFVYKVAVGGRMYIKKEIPGPDAVEEFLYEINALSALQDSKSVIKFEGIIVDENSELIKGLLISYADQGALVDLIYDFKNSESLQWERRVRWARQIVEGLSEIHEAGFVQGDFTLSNIVIDHYDNAKIIDINRRGCPVGWEPPELARLIESGQRISIYIGVKSDLFQLGMVLWALAEQHDEPERQERPLSRHMSRHVPQYYKDIVRDCLNEIPRERPSARDILRHFPDGPEEPTKPTAADALKQSISTHRSDKEYIDPATAVDLDDITKARRPSRSRSSFSNINMPSTEYIGSSGSYILPNETNGRERSPIAARRNSRNRRSGCSPYPGPRSVMSLDDSEIDNELASLPASRDTRWEQVYVDGDTKLVQRGGGEIDVQDFATQEPKEVCITTPPGELDSSFIGSKTSEETPLSLSTVAELQPIQPQQLSEALDQGIGPAQRGDVDSKAPDQIHLPPLTVAELQPIEPQQLPESVEQDTEPDHRRGIGSKASFSDRVHQLTDTSTSPNRTSQIPNSFTLADLENEILDSSVMSSAVPSRVSTGFSEFFHRPLHQDSGFSEPERVSYESERIRQSLEAQIADLKFEQRDEERVNERLWDEKDGTMIGIGDGVRGSQLVIKPDAVPSSIAAPDPFPAFALHAHPDPTSTPALGIKDVVSEESARDKALEEKISNTTIRPPNILIPEFHHEIPKAVDTSPPFLTPGTGELSRQSVEGTLPLFNAHNRPEAEPANNGGSMLRDGRLEKV